MDGSLFELAPQYLTFLLGGETYALDIGKVREVLDFTSVTGIPRMPDFMRGVINLRGRVVPIVDLRRKFGMPPAEDAAAACVIIADVSVDGDRTMLGALADSVQEVIDLDPAGVEAAPRIGAQLRTDFIRGMGSHGGKFIIILDIDRVFSADDLSQVRSAVPPPDVRREGNAEPAAAA